MKYKKTNNITNVTTIITKPGRHNYVIVKVETEQKITGFGCATFQQRPKLVKENIDKYLKPLIIGKNANNINDLWSVMYYNGYWRNGPVMNNAISGIDMALWDIKSKTAGMPLYEILGGQVKNHIDLYAHADAENLPSMLEKVSDLEKKGFKYIRCQLGLYAGTKVKIKEDSDYLQGNYFNAHHYINETTNMLKVVEKKFGRNISLIHDVHECLSPVEARRFLKKIDDIPMYFIEDIVSIEQIDSLKDLKNVTTNPIAIGELINNDSEYKYLIKNNLVDYLRIHVSQVGGITPAIKIAHFAEMNNINIVWHSPRDLSPIGFSVNAHLNLSIKNTTIMEYEDLGKEVNNLFEIPYFVKEGKLYMNECIGIGSSLDFEEASKYPHEFRNHPWTTLRKLDGSITAP